MAWETGTLKTCVASTSITACSMAADRLSRTSGSVGRRIWLARIWRPSGEGVLRIMSRWSGYSLEVVVGIGVGEDMGVGCCRLSVLEGVYLYMGSSSLGRS